MGWKEFKGTVAKYYDKLVKENRVEIVKTDEDNEENLDDDLEKRTVSNSNLVLEINPFEGIYQGQNE